MMKRKNKWPSILDQDNKEENQTTKMKKRTNLMMNRKRLRLEKLLRDW
jgi:hypothetical protein